MNYIKIYQDEVSDLAYTEYANMPHAIVHDDHIVFYTIDPQEIYHEQN